MFISKEWKKSGSRKTKGAKRHRNRLGEKLIHKLIVCRVRNYKTDLTWTPKMWLKNVLDMSFRIQCQSNWRQKRSSTAWLDVKYQIFFKLSSFHMIQAALWTFGCEGSKRRKESAYRFTTDIITLSWLTAIVMHNNGKKNPWSNT